MNRHAGMATAAGRLTNCPAHGFSAVFRTMARLRQAPAVHPSAVTFAARLIVSHQTPLIGQGNYLATVKLSKGAGTPGRWPDVLGLGLRFHPLNAGPCDVLFSSAGDGRWTRWLPVPAADWSGARYGTLAPYESAGRWWWLRLTPSGPPVGHASIHALGHSSPPSFALHISGGTAAWHQVGRLELDERLDDTGLVLDPVLNHPPGALPAPNWLRELRKLAYSGSRRGRDAPPPDQQTVRIEGDHNEDRQVANRRPAKESRWRRPR